MPEKAREILKTLQVDFNCQYEEKDSIGKRYRRQDAIGTPFCITVDHQTLEDNTDRNTMKRFDRDTMKFFKKECFYFYTNPSDKALSGNFLPKLLPRLKCKSFFYVTFKQNIWYFP